MGADTVDDVVPHHEGPEEREGERRRDEASSAIGHPLRSSRRRHAVAGSSWQAKTVDRGAVGRIRAHPRNPRLFAVKCFPKETFCGAVVGRA